jgi:ribosomal protein S12 methylthiotransferase
MKIKERVPGIVLRTTFIVGYPNETEKEFNELLDFIEQIQFDRIGAFTYSVEEKTPAFILGDPVSEEEKEDRKMRLMEFQSQISLRKNQAMIGKKLKVVIDDIEGEYYLARSEREAPEVDGEIYIKPGKKGLLKVGNFYNVDIYDCNEYDLYAKIS